MILIARCLIRWEGGYEIGILEIVGNGSFCVSRERMLIGMAAGMANRMLSGIFGDDREVHNTICLLAQKNCG